jgi:hypothetical protein
MDMQEFNKNRSRFPQERLELYAGKYVAWSPDGTEIIASADDVVELAAAVKASRYNSAECVLSSVPYPDEVLLGGLGMSE